MEIVFIRLKKIPSLIFPLYAPEIFKILLIIISIGLTPPFDSFPDSALPDDFPTFCDKEGSCLIVLSVFRKQRYVHDDDYLDFISKNEEDKYNDKNHEAPKPEFTSDINFDDHDCDCCDEDCHDTFDDDRRKVIKRKKSRKAKEADL